MRFTQASVLYNIPKGTLYDNILGKSNRMDVLERSGLNATDENVVLEFCCDLSKSPYNRRTRKPLSEILEFVFQLENCNRSAFDESGKFAYRWWWAFCKKYSVVSLHYDNNANVKIKSEIHWDCSLFAREREINRIMVKFSVSNIRQSVHVPAECTPHETREWIYVCRFYVYDLWKEKSAKWIPGLAHCIGI